MVLQFCHSAEVEKRIYTFQTRRGTEIRRATLDNLAELGVNHSSIPLNEELFLFDLQGYLLLEDVMSAAEDDRELIKHLSMRPGSLLIFNEALLHGTLPWLAPDRVRRAILFKYSPGFFCPLAADPFAVTPPL